MQGFQKALMGSKTPDTFQIVIKKFIPPKEMRWKKH